ncbi:MAG TPA: hypothetical protein VED40_03875 [Azospirillaceae bacterium]|nr:hypothetical protein [Azospirillaceae bacterium]
MARPQTKRRQSRREREKAGNVKGAVLLSLAAIFAVGVGYFSWKANSEAVELDKTTLCPTAGPTSVTAVVVDRTDTVTPVQRQLLVDKFNEIRGAVPKYGLLEIYTVNPVQASVLKPEFSLCNPGDGSDLSHWTSNPRMANRTWGTVFNAPLAAVLDGMLEASEARQSPILETIQSVAATAFAPHDAVPRTLVVVSDLLQHSDNLSQYQGVRDFEELRKTPALTRVKADLREVDVRVLYIRRDTAKGVQGAAHIRFWQAYFADQGATLSNALSLF